MKKLYFIILSILVLFSCKSKNSDYTIDPFNAEYAKDTITLTQPLEIDESIGSGHITTIADGYDVKFVNLWNSSSKDRKVIARMYKGEKIKIIEDDDPYYYIEIVKTNTKGYCMKGFITSIKWNSKR